MHSLGFVLYILLFVVIFALCIKVVLDDIRERKILTRDLWLLLALRLILLFTDFSGALAHGFSAISIGLIFGFLYVFMRSKIGLGDVFLATILGSFLNVGHIPGFLIFTGVLAIIYIISTGQKKTPLALPLTGAFFLMLMVGWKDILHFPHLKNVLT